jgi:hypothetical protein
MANGDLAVSEGGFTAVLPAEDFRLGYDRINTVADLAVKRGIRSFASQTTMNAVPGKFYGDLCIRQDDKITYRWNGSAWKPWYGPWVGFSPALTGVNLGTGGTSSMQWRWENGLVHFRGDIAQGSGSAITDQVTMTLPVNANENYRRIGTLTVSPPSGAQYPGWIQSAASGTNGSNLLVELANGTFVASTTLAPNQPLAAQQSTVWRVDCLYESSSNPIG